MNAVFFKLLPKSVRVKLEGRHIFQRAIGNTGWLLADNVIRIGIGFLVTVWMARYLGPGQYGLLSFALAFVALFSSMSTLGLDTLIVRNIVQTPSAKDEMLGTAFVLKLAGGLVTSALAIGTIYYLAPSDSLKRWLVAITAAGVVFQAVDTIDYWFQSQIQSKYTVYAKNSAFLMVAAVKLALILLRAPLIAFAWAGLAEIVLASAGLVIAYTVTGSKLTAWNATITTSRKLLRDSWPLILSGIVGMIYLRIDQVMLGEMVNSEEVGIYSVAVRIAEASYFIPMAVASSVFPAVVEAKKISEALFYERLQKLYNFMAFIGYAIAVPVSLFSSRLITIIFGGDYARSAPMLVVLIWAGLFVNLGVARSSFLIPMNWTKVHFMTVLLGSLINVVLNVMLIPLYGGMGAAIASIAAYWLAAHGSCFLYKPLRKTGFMLTKAIIYPIFW